MSLWALFDVATPDMPTFDASRCRVTKIGNETAAIVVAEAHYIGTLGSTSVSLGMYVDDVLAGVITYGTIPANNARSVCGPAWGARVLELSRLALYDWAPKNSESWFIGQSFHWLRRNRPDIALLLSYADSAVGHRGVIYQATNWVYTGASTNDVVYVVEATGTVLHPRTIGRRKGCLPPGKWRPSPAKHRYVQFLGSRTQRSVLRRNLRWSPLPYPKGELLAVLNADRGQSKAA